MLHIYKKVHNFKEIVPYICWNQNTLFIKLSKLSKYFSKSHRINNKIGLIIIATLMFFPSVSYNSNHSNISDSVSDIQERISIAMVRFT